LLLVLALISIVCISYLSETVRSVDSPVAGLAARIDSGQTVHLVIVHGIGGHCIGYSNALVAGIVKHLGLVVKRQSLSSGKPETNNEQNYNGNCPNGDELDPGQEVGPKLQLLPKQKELCADLYRYNRSCQEINFDPSDDFDQTLGFITTSDYASSQAADEPPKLRVYELVWDPSTRWAKQTYVQYLDRLDDDQRTLFNRQGKWRLINDAITDAVLYLGDYKTQMQFAVFMAFCKIMTREEANRPENLFYCTPKDVAERFAERNHIAVISHSLGTRMVFDTLAQTGDPVGLVKTIERLKIPVPGTNDDTHKISTAFRDGVGSIYAFANQIPLLEMGLIKKRQDFVNIRAEDKDLPPPVDLGTRFQTFLDTRLTSRQVPDRVEPLQIVAFTDHDDFLSFNLKCWYYLNVLRFNQDIVRERERHTSAGGKVDAKYQFKRCESGGEKEFWDVISDKITISNVIVRLGLRVPWLFSNPVGAHSNYWRDDEVHQLIACGTIDTRTGVKLATCKRSGSAVASRS
jgi:hypothetical protein